MKKIISMLITLFLLLGLMSCDSGDKTPILGISMIRFNPWLETTEASDVVMVEKIFDYYEAEPDRVIDGLYTESEEYIANLLEYFAEVKLTPSINLSIYRGDSQKYVFTFADGSTKEIVIKHGYFVSDGLGIWARHSEQGLSGEGYYEKTYRFNVLNSSFIVFDYDDKTEPVKEVESGADCFRFAPYDGEIDKNTKPSHYIETSYAKITVYTDRLCYVDVIDDGFGFESGYYQLIGSSFDSICGE